MKQRTDILRTAAAVGALVVCASLLPAGASSTNATVVAHARTANTPAATAPAIVAQPVPKSTFIVPRKAKEGRDPFFPNSTRAFGNQASIATPETPIVVADLALKGISGTQERPLAIINSTTFTVGETNEVITKNGRVRVQCLEINMSASTVLVQVEGERRILRL